MIFLYKGAIMSSVINIYGLSFRVKWVPKEIKDHQDFMAKREVWMTLLNIFIEVMV